MEVHRAVPNNPYREWVLPHVDLDALKSKENEVSWLTFWMYDVERVRMPRFWLHWAFLYALGLLKGRRESRVMCN